MGDRIHCLLVLLFFALVWMDVSVAIVPVVVPMVFGICLSLIPMSMGSPLHVMSTSSSLKTDTPSFVKTETVPSSAVLPTLIKDEGKSWNVSACVAWTERCRKGSWVMYLALLVPPLATPTVRVDERRMGRPALR